METDLSVPVSPAFLKVTWARAQVCSRVFTPSLPRSVTPKFSGRWATRAAHPPRSAPLARPLRPAALSLGCSRGFRGGSGSQSSLHGDTASLQARSSEISASGEQSWSSRSTFRGIVVVGSPAGKQPRSDIPVSAGTQPSLGTTAECPPPPPQTSLPQQVGAPKNRQNGRLLVFDPKDHYFLIPTSLLNNYYFGCRPRLASKLYTSPAQVSPNAKTLSPKKEVSSKKNKDKISFKNTENKIPSKSTESKDIITNRHSDLSSSSFRKESKAGKDAVLAKQEKNNEDCLQDTNDKFSDSTDSEGEDDTNDEDDKGSNTKKESRAPLELMAEFLRAEMGRDYQLAKKLCQMILIYEPENPVAKEFFSLIEEILLKEKTQTHQEDEEDSKEDSSSESEGENSKDASDYSSDECDES
uniref:Glutamate rich 2 n=1 Tax=Nannospalax galili TaxID=1026970 RepID=A0A8C6RC39_NANGA